MKRSGFTMIELVFVIVILGILASVAIPKLAATRDDAQIAKSTSEITSLIQDVGSYYTAQGSLAKLSDMTNVKLVDNTGTDAANTDLNGTSTVTLYYYDSKRDKKCLDVTFNDVNGTVSIEKNTADADSSIFCKGLANALEQNSIVASGGAAKTYTFGGSSIYK